MNIFEEVTLMRDAGVVKRSHTCRTLMDRNVAEHSHGVAMLVLLLYKAAGRMPSANLLASALVHDLSEIATGDVPAPVKREHKPLRDELHHISEAWEAAHGLRFELTPAEAKMLLWCDRMDFALFALEEVTMGNRFFEVYLMRILEWLDGMDAPSDHAAQLQLSMLKKAHEL